jgi:large subunit ribosomal protein L11
MKRITGYIRLEIEAGKASPSPPVGPALGLRGLNIMQFCKDFNNECRSQGIKEGIPVPTLITVYDDRTYTFKLKTPSVSYLIKKILNVTKGAAKTGKDAPFIMDTRLLYEIAVIKHKGSNQSLRSIYKSIVGSVKSVGANIRKY